MSITGIHALFLNGREDEPLYSESFLQARRFMQAHDEGGMIIRFDSLEAAKADFPGRTFTHLSALKWQELRRQNGCFAQAARRARRSAGIA